MTTLGTTPPNVDLKTTYHALPVGIVMPYAALSTSSDANGQIAGLSGWLYCRGQNVDAATFPLLDALIGAAAPTGAVHAFNGGSAPAAGKFSAPNLQRTIPIHKMPTGGSTTATVLGGLAGALAYGDPWSHYHTKGSLVLDGHYHGVSGVTFPSHSHAHNLSMADHTHTIGGAVSDAIVNTGDGYTSQYVAQTTGGVSGSLAFSGAFPTDGGGNIHTGYRSGTAASNSLAGTQTGSVAGPGAPYLFVNYIIKAS